MLGDARGGSTLTLCQLPILQRCKSTAGLVPYKCTVCAIYIYDHVGTQGRYVGSDSDIKIDIVGKGIDNGNLLLDRKRNGKGTERERNLCRAKERCPL